MIDQSEASSGIQPALQPVKGPGRSKPQMCPKCHSPGKLVGRATFGLTTTEQHRCKSPRCGHLWSPAQNQPQTQPPIAC